MGSSKRNLRCHSEVGLRQIVIARTAAAGTAVRRVVLGRPAGRGESDRPEPVRRR